MSDDATAVRKSRKNKPGRKAYQATEQQRADVRIWKAAGISDASIADLLGVARNTLLRHFTVDLRSGPELARALNLKRLDAAAEAGNVAAMKFLELRYAAASAAASIRPLEAQGAKVVEQHELGRRDEKLRLAREAVSTHHADWGDDLLVLNFEQIRNIRSDDRRGLPFG